MEPNFDSLKNKYPKSKGLKQEDYMLLNDVNLRGKKRRELLAVKRKEYEKNPVALQHIDGFDPESQYIRNHREYVLALKSKNNRRIKELEDWFQTNYPDI